MKALQMENLEKGKKHILVGVLVGQNDGYIFTVEWEAFQRLWKKIELQHRIKRFSMDFTPVDILYAIWYIEKRVGASNPRWARPEREVPSKSICCWKNRLHTATDAFHRRHLAKAITVIQSSTSKGCLKKCSGQTDDFRFSMRMLHLPLRIISFRSIL